MGIKRYKPYTPSRRHMTVSTFDEITKTTPEKSLVVHLKKNSGRNAQGKITVRHKGGGAKIKYRLVDFKRNKDGIPAKVQLSNMILTEQLISHSSFMLMVLNHISLLLLALK